MSATNSTASIRDIPGFPGYQVGDDGSAWSLWKQVSNGRRRGTRCVIGGERRRLKGFVCESGHIRVTLYRDSKPRAFQIGQLVLMAFAGHCPDGMECRHLDGNPANNHLHNVRWGTRLENAADKARHGTSSRGTKNVRAKLREADISAIRELRASGLSYNKLAARFGVTYTTIRRIFTDNGWAHV